VLAQQNNNTKSILQADRSLKTITERNKMNEGHHSGIAEKRRQMARGRMDRQFPCSLEKRTGG
jgi:hypothetical protein